MFNIYEDTEVPHIVCENFLPTHMVNKLYDGIGEIEEEFGHPQWSSLEPGDLGGAKHQSLCIGKDVWLPIPKKLDHEGNPSALGELSPWYPSVFGDYLQNYLFHQGVRDFLMSSKNDVFRLIASQIYPDGKMHIIAYENKEYYNWHKDGTVSGGPMMFTPDGPSRMNLCTYNLILCTNEKIKGGDLLVMKDGVCKRVPLKHNTLVIHPSNIMHSVQEVKLEKTTPLRERRVSVQFWHAGTVDFSSMGQ